jgi:hypothetical protein
MSADPFSLTISTIALTISAVTAWLTLRRGNLVLARPLLIAFLYDLPAGEPKILFRASLYTTGKRGRIVESMHLKIRRGEYSHTFSFWGYGETAALVVGGGLHVGEDGVVHYHHFLPPQDGTTFQFLPGEYVVEVYATLVNRTRPVRLRSLALALSENLAESLKDKSIAVLYNWGPESKTYHPHTDRAPSRGRDRSVSGSGYENFGTFR